MAVASGPDTTHVPLDGPLADADAELESSPRNKNAVQTLGSRALPSKSTALGRALHERRAALVDDLGGDPSTAQLAMIDMATRTKLLLDSVDAYVLAMPSGPVIRQRRCLHPVVRERASLVNQLQSLVRDLGLERRPRDVPDLRATSPRPQGRNVAPLP